MLTEKEKRRSLNEERFDQCNELIQAIAPCGREYQEIIEEIQELETLRKDYLKLSYRLTLINIVPSAPPLTQDEIDLIKCLVKDQISRVKMILADKVTTRITKKQLFINNLLELKHSHCLNDWISQFHSEPIEDE